MVVLLTSNLAQARANDRLHTQLHRFCFCEPVSA
jgi:hypothetical protein